MITPIEQFKQLYQEALDQFKSLKHELRPYGLEVDPQMEIRTSKGMEYYYSLTDGHIYVANLDLTTTSGKLTKIFLKSLLKCDNDDELFEFLRLFQGHVIAHELAHHFRHQAGVFDKQNLWEEEQLANQFATAVRRHKLSPEVRKRSGWLLQRAIESIGKQMSERNIATDTYYNFGLSLNATGVLSDEAFDNLELISRITGRSQEELLKQSGQIPDNVLERLERRDDLIQEINEEYTADMIRYMYYHLNWIYYDLTVQTTHYVDEFIRVSLNRPAPLLSTPFIGLYIDNRVIQACYQAYLKVPDVQPTLKRYFYKRYRSLMIRKLSQVMETPDAKYSRVNMARLVGRWSGSEESLDYLATFGPPELRPLFPSAIANHLPDDLALPDHLPTETDRALWKYGIEGIPDAAAAKTLALMAIVDQTDIFGELPAEVLLEIVRLLYVVRLQAGERMVWQGERNDDLYIVLHGQLNVVVDNDNTQQEVAALKQGDVFGEMSFLTKNPRSAHVIAAGDVQVGALKDADLHLLTHRYPEILLHIAVVLSHRVEKLNSELKRKLTDSMSGI